MNGISELKNHLSSALTLLAHDIRGALSILQNDLSYLRAKYPNEDLSSSLVALSRITALVSLFESASTDSCTVEWLRERARSHPAFFINAIDSSRAIKIPTELLFNSLTNIATAINDCSFTLSEDKDSLMVSVSPSLQQIESRLSSSAQKITLSLLLTFCELSSAKIMSSSEATVIRVPYV